MYSSGNFGQNKPTFDFLQDFQHVYWSLQKDPNLIFTQRKDLAPKMRYFLGGGPKIQTDRRRREL